MVVWFIPRILWCVVGFSLAFGDDLGGFIGNPLTFFMFDNVGTAPHPTLGTGLPFVLFAGFQLKFAIIIPALIIGAFAERIKFWSYLVFICLFTLLIYCPLAYWAWHPEGFLFKRGVLDFTGASVGHISAGCSALAGAVVLELLLYHLLALVIVFTFTFAGSYLILKFTQLLMSLRVYPENEWMGLDVSQHMESVYEKEASQ